MARGQGAIGALKVFNANGPDPRVVGVLAGVNQAGAAQLCCGRREHPAVMRFSARQSAAGVAAR